MRAVDPPEGTGVAPAPAALAETAALGAGGDGVYNQGRLMLAS
jgi:hypothetical protein